MPFPSTPRRVVVIGLGGTIAMTAETIGGVVPALTVEQLIEAVPGLTALGVAVEVVNFRSRPGASLSFTDLTALAAEIDARMTGGATGVVITQGTDTIEESAYFLDLLHGHPQPVVVTGAMRHPTLAGADGPANLLAAISVAASPAAREQGCLVVLNDEIHAAGRVRKTHSTSTATFVSPNGGPLGYVIEGRPTIVNPFVRRYTIDRRPNANQIRVGLHTAPLGDDGTTLAVLAEHLDGLIVAGFGVGHVPGAWVQTLTDIAGRIPVVLASRTGAGPVLSNTYGFAGSERDLLARGLIPAGLLDPFKARILLHTLLASGETDPAAVRKAFTTAGGLTDPESTDSLDPAYVRRDGRRGDA